MDTFSSNRIIAFTIALIIFSLPVFSAPNSEGTYSKGSALAVPSMPDRNKKFPGIDPQIIYEIEVGTVKSLKHALSMLHQSDQDYSADQAVLMNIISTIMKVLYPNEKIQWPIPDASDDDVYMPLLASIEKGVYDFNSKEKDFLSLLLPSLVLITSPNVTNYYREATRNLNQAIQQNPSSFAAYYLRGMLSYRTNKFEEAAGFFLKGYEIDKSYSPLNKHYVNSLVKTGKGNEASILSMKLLDIDPENLDLLKLSAYSYMKENNWEKAEEYITRALQVQPDNPEFILLRAKILMSRGEYLNVSSLLDVYSRSDTSAKDYLVLRATLQRDWNKNYSSAAATINEALELYPHDIDVMLFAVSLMVSSSQKIGSRTSTELLDEIQSKDPLNVEAQKLRLVLLSEAQNWKAAYDLGSKLVQKPNCSQDIILEQIKICLKLRKTSEARNLLSKLPSQNNSTYDLVQIQIMILDGNKNDALRQISSSLSKDYSNIVKSSLYYEKSRLASSDEQKLADLRASLTSNPRNPDSLFALYQYYFDRKDYRKSQYYLKQAVALNPQSQHLMELSSTLEKILSQE